MDTSVRFRLTSRQQVFTVVPLAVSLSLVVYLQAAFLGAGAAGLSGAAALVALVGSMVLVRWWGIELTTDEVIVRRNVTRRVPWAEVGAVRTERSGTSHFVVIENDRGRKFRSPAPANGILLADSDFEAKVAYIEQWWRWAHHHSARPASAWPLPSDVGWAQRVIGPS